MIFKLFYKKTIPGTANMEVKEIKGHYITIETYLNRVLIDNIEVASVNELHSIDFIINGYKNVIEF